jgi:hypothetical protein
VFTTLEMMEEFAVGVLDELAEHFTSEEIDVLRDGPDDEREALWASRRAAAA